MMAGHVLTVGFSNLIMLDLQETQRSNSYLIVNEHVREVAYKGERFEKSLRKMNQI
jgi:hypothetical protein